VAKCLVVGANGFIGSNLVDELVRSGHTVTAFDRFSSNTAMFTSEGVNTVAGDFMNVSDIAEAVHGQDFVFHFLSTTTPATAENDPTMDVRTNIASSIELFQHSVDAGVQKIFFASTGGAIYGDQPGEHLNERLRPLPVSPYAIGKLAIEGYLRYFRTKYGIDTVSFRISNPYGPRQRPHKKQGVIPIFLHRMQAGLPIVLFGDGTMVRDYQYVDDTVKMIAGTVGHSLDHDVYNIGSGRGATLTDVLEVMKKVTGIEPMIEHKPTPSTYLDRVVLDVSRYQEQFGFTEPLALEDGIRATWEHLVREEKP
jgi:UDP-glucose 4-epimerase